jgi:hypothetical protein
MTGLGVLPPAGIENPPEGHSRVKLYDHVSTDCVVPGNEIAFGCRVRRRRTDRRSGIGGERYGTANVSGVEQGPARSVGRTDCLPALTHN